MPPTDYIPPTDAPVGLFITANGPRMKGDVGDSEHFRTTQSVAKDAYAALPHDRLRPSMRRRYRADTCCYIELNADAVPSEPECVIMAVVFGDRPAESCPFVDWSGRLRASGVSQ